MNNAGEMKKGNTRATKHPAFIFANEGRLQMDTWQAAALAHLAVMAPAEEVEMDDDQEEQTRIKLQRIAALTEQEVLLAAGGMNVSKLKEFVIPELITAVQEGDYPPQWFPQ